MEAARAAGPGPGFDERLPTTNAGVQARGDRGRRRHASHARPLVALYLAGEPARPEEPGDLGNGAAVRRQARHRRGAVHLQMGDRCAGRPRHRAARARQRHRLGAGDAGDDDVGLWRHAHPDGGADAIARRHFRQSGDERGAPPGHAHLRPYAHAVVALSSRAQDRRAHPRSRTRPQRHRDNRAHGALAAGADHRRAGPDRRRAAVPLRLALRRRHHDHGRALYVVHLSRHRMAHQHPPRDEFERHRRQRQGDRFAAQLRDGEIFLRRDARGPALRPLDGALRGGERQGLRLARRAQCRTGGGVHPRPRRHHGAVRLRHPARHQHRRRFRHDQRHDDPALPAAQFHGHGLSRDQAGGDRHRDHVLDALAQARDRGQTGRQAAASARRHHPLRQRLVRL